MGRRAQRRSQTATGPATPGPAGTAVPALRSADLATSPVTTRPTAAAASDEVSLDRLGDLVTARRLIDAEMAVLVDALAAAGTSWSAIAAVLGVSRQAARQAHRRTGRRSSPAAGASAAGSSP